MLDTNVRKFSTKLIDIQHPLQAFLLNERGGLVLDAEKESLERETDNLRNSVICGDCLEAMPDMPKDSVDAVITDPPYHIGEKGKLTRGKGELQSMEDLTKTWEQKESCERFGFVRKTMENLHRVLKESGTLVFFYDRFRITRVLRIGEKIGYYPMNIYALIKKNPIPNFRKAGFRSGFELAAILNVSESERKFHYLDKPSKMINYHVYSPSQDLETDHPTEKPVGPLKDLIKMFTDPGDLVFDPFCGSGSTLVAAQETERDWIGVEKNPKYAEMAEERLNLHTRKIEEFCTEGPVPSRGGESGK